jgi:hypothetical protein
MKILPAVPGALIALGGGVMIGFGVKAELTHAAHAHVVQILGGIWILTFGVFFATVSYLAPKYGRRVGRSYFFDDGSPMALIIPLGIGLIILEGAGTYCFARFFH